MMKKIDEGSKVSFALGIAVIFAIVFLAFAFNGHASANTEIEQPTISYQTHIQNIGWQGNVGNNVVAGTTGQGLRLEAFKVSIDNAGTSYSGGVSYQAHVQNIGWQNSVSNGQVAGTTGKGLRVEAIRLTLNGDLATKYDIYYRVHAQNFGWLSWSKNGNSAGTTDLGLRLEAVEIQLVPKGQTFAEDTQSSFIQGSTLTTQAHVQNIGWQGGVGNNVIAGTTGQGLRMEALRATLDNSGLSGDIVYQAHVQNDGWQNSVSDSQIAGTVGQGKRLEALKIKLTGQVAQYYDIYYRAHIQDYGWLDWTKDDNTAGSVGVGKRLEAVQIQLVRKGTASVSVGNKAVITTNASTNVNKPTYFSQLDSRWSGVRFRHTTIGTDGCVPASLAMVLKGSYGLNVDPVSVAQKMAPMNSWYAGASGQDLVKTAKAYGRSVEEISDKNRAIAVLKSGVPLIMYVNVGIGHAVAVYGYNNGQVNTYDPYNWKFYGSVSSFDALWNNPSVDYNMDWDAGRPVFAIR